ncbi:MAG: hypothetical protein R3F56_10670 [Planctomycetota bacterium]
MSLEPTVFLVHFKILQGQLGPNALVPVPDFLLRMANAAAGARVERPSQVDQHQQIYNLSMKLEEIRKAAAGDAQLSLPWPSTWSNGIWVESPDTVVSRATDQIVEGQPMFAYKFDFDGEETHVEFSASLGFA